MAAQPAPGPQAPRKHPMVDWYDPFQLLSTGIEVLISTAMGRRFDYRMMEDVALKQAVFDYSRDEPLTETAPPRDELWFDYLADAGDGWYPTHAIASLVAQEQLKVDRLELPRGRFLVMGGDEVYPTASQKFYRERLVAPYEAALPRTKPPHPHLFAIPGNHDWYDGLVSFSRRFTHGRWIGGWLTRQARSYFALKLPHRWWLWAVDVQLESDIDYGQLEYFRQVAQGPQAGQGLQPGDRVILLSAEPDWIYRDIKDPIAESNLAYLEDRIIPKGVSVYLWLAGDLHHYRRHEKVGDPRFQRITSGGGGAFLHPTHRPAKRTVSVGGDRFERKAAFPSRRSSFRLSLGNLFFLIRNWKLGIVTGVAYTALMWGREPSWRDPIAHPTSLIWGALILGGFILYADKDHPWFRWLGGFVHGTIHLMCAFLIAAWVADAFDSSTAAGLAKRLAANFFAGGIVGPTLLGFYLLLALNLFGAHPNEAFSSLRIEGFKHFLRLHITRLGHLEIYPVGVRRVSHNDSRLPNCSLIEPPIVIRA